MNICLYYIEGISATDEPWFKTAALQQAFFNANLVDEIDESFYPPHYRNRIRLDKASLQLKDQINYLSLTAYDIGSGNTRTYYYFIDDIQYISEDVIELLVTMDTLQTFMFDVSFTGAIIERQFINRYNYHQDIDGNESWTINRDYIRENFSAGVFVQTGYEYLDEHLPYLMVNLTSKGNTANLTKTGNISYRETAAATGAEIPSFPARFVNLTEIDIVPFDITYGNDNQILHDIAEADNDTKYNLYTIFNQWSVDPDSAVIYVIPLVSLGTALTRSTGISKRGGTFNYSSDMYTKITPNASSSYLLLHNSSQTGTPYTQWTTLATLQLISINRSTTAVFGSANVPALLDNNYVHIYYGEKQNLCTIPLEVIDSDTLYFRAFASLFDGTRIYGIGESAYDCQFRLGSYVLINKAEMMTTWNDTYTSWQANNRATIAGAAVGYLASYITGGMKTGAAITANAEMSRATDRYYDNLNNTAGRVYNLDQSIARNRQLQSQYGSNAVGGVQGLINTATAQYNAYFAPDSIKAMGTFFIDYISGACRIVRVMEQVSDFEYCAELYHKNGYLVNKAPTLANATDKATWSQLYGNERYYFQVLKLKEGTPVIANTINSRAIQDDIMIRLRNGIRMWWTNDNGALRANYIGNFQYDNVEVLFIKES